MRIAVFTRYTTLHKNFGGLETQNRLLCEGLASRGHDITVFAQQNDISQDATEKNGVNYVFIKASYQYLFASLNKNSWQNKSYEVFAKQHTQTPFDIVLSQSTGGIGIIKRKKELRVKILSIAHGTTVGEWKTFFMNIRSLKDLYWAIRNTQYVLRQFFGRQREYILHSDRVIAVSNVVKKQLMEETFVPEERVVVVHNGVDEKKFSEYTRKRQDREENEWVELLYVGRVIRSKGVFVLIDALKGEEFDGVRLNVVGAGEDLVELKEYVTTCGIENRVIFYGSVPYSEVISRFFEADIFVLPSVRIEGFPMVLAEAMLAGLPVVAADIGGNSDAVEEGVTGFLTPPKDVALLKKRILTLVNNPQLRKDFGQKAQERAKQEFTLDVMLKKYEQVLREVLK
jgi:glycosyltransferase involved in cell wall biosynthesis